MRFDFIRQGVAASAPEVRLFGCRRVLPIMSVVIAIGCGSAQRAPKSSVATHNAVRQLKLVASNRGSEKAPEIDLTIEGVQQNEIWLPTFEAKSSIITKPVSPNEAAAAGCFPAALEAGKPLYSYPYDGRLDPFWRRAGVPASEHSFKVAKGWYQTTAVFSRSADGKESHDLALPIAAVLLAPQY